MLPTFNERDNIKSIIETILLTDPSIEILVVDDQSPDGTGDMVDVMSRDQPRLHLLSRKERGRGTAGRAGFKWAVDHGYDYLIEMDADFSHDPAYIPDLLARAQEFDIVIGSRYIEGGGVPGWSKKRKVISQVANVFIRVVMGLSMADCTGGYKLFHVDALKKLDLDNYISDSCLYDGPETLLRVTLLGATWVEVPIVFRERKAGASKFTFEKIIRNFINNIKLRYYLGRP